MDNKTTYTIRYQLGAIGSSHRTLSGAIRALKRARNVSRREGDLQAIYIEADDRELTEAERDAIARATYNR